MVKTYGSLVPLNPTENEKYLQFSPALRPRIVSVWTHVNKFTLVVGFGLCMMLLYGIRQSPLISSFTGKSVDYSLYVTNDYTGMKLQMSAYSFLDNSILLEPWRDNYITINGHSSSCEGTWTLAGKGNISDEIFRGIVGAENTLTVVPHRTGFYTLRIALKCGREVIELNKNVAVKYVRRDITTLTGWHSIHELLVNECIMCISRQTTTARSSWRPYTPCGE